VLTLVTSAGAQADRTVTDDDGRYRLSADRPGAYLLLTVAPGHRPVAEHVLLHDDAVLRRDLTAGSDLRARA
jgi:protocatechuate 3,4-dioxygenase beta subunit